MTNPSPRPRVLLESDAGAMDQLIRRGEQAATVAEQKALELSQAGQSLEQLKATVPATAKSAAELATAQAKATLDAATLAANQAAVTAQTATATLPKFRSTDQNNPPAPTQGELDANPNGIGGSRLTADGATQLLKWTPHTTAGAWVASGAPLPTTTQVADAKKTATDAATLADNAKEAADTAKSVADTAQAQADAVRAALSNTALSDLKTRKRADGPQQVDGSRWLPQVTGSIPENGGTTINGVDCVWVREFNGPVYPRWFGARGDGVTNDALAMKRAIDAAPEWGVVDGEGKKYLLGHIPDDKLARIRRGKVTLRNLWGYLDVTGGGRDLVSCLTFDAQPDPARPKTRDEFEAQRIFGVTLEDVHLRGQRWHHRNVTGEVGEIENGGRHGFRFLGRISGFRLIRCSALEFPTDGCMIFSGNGLSAALGAEASGTDVCFRDIYIEDCQFDYNGRMGMSWDSIDGIEVTGKTTIRYNGRHMPYFEPASVSGDYWLHGAAGRATWPENPADRTVFGNGIDAEGYGVGSTVRNVKIGPDVVIRDNARAALLALVTPDEFLHPAFAQWSSWDIQCELGKGSDATGENAAVTIAPNGDAGGRVIFRSMQIRPRKLTGIIILRDAAEPTVAPGNTGDFNGANNWASLQRLYGAKIRVPKRAASDTSTAYTENVEAAWSGYLTPPGAPTLEWRDGTKISVVTPVSADLLEQGDGYCLYQVAANIKTAEVGGESTFALLTTSPWRVASVTGSTRGFEVDESLGTVRPISRSEYGLGWGSRAAQTYRVGLLVRLVTDRLL